MNTSPGATVSWIPADGSPPVDLTPFLGRRPALRPRRQWVACCLRPPRYLVVPWRTWPRPPVPVVSFKPPPARGYRWDMVGIDMYPARAAAFQHWQPHRDWSLEGDRPETLEQLMARYQDALRVLLEATD